MKSKILLSLSLFLGGASFLANAQTYGLWQGQSNATPFEYNIATGTLGTTYTAGGTAQSSISTSSSTGYLASPSSGTLKVFTAANGGGGFTINGSTLALTSSTTAATLNKFAFYGVDGTSAVTSIFLKLKIESNPNGGAFILGFGKSGQSGDDIFANDKQLDVGLTNPDPGIFGAFRFQPGNSQTNAGARFLRTSDNTYRYTDPQYGNSYSSTFVKNTDISLEIYINNTSVPRNYSRGVDNYTLPARTYNVFANGTLFTVERQPGDGNTNLVSNIPSTELAIGEKIDAIFIAGHNAASNQLIISVSDIKFGWIPQNVLPVELISFMGKKTANGIQLNWSTATEKDNAYFEILRAAEDGVFKAIGKVNGKGSGNYQFVDNNPSSGKNYYKLKQVDLNGDSKEFEPVAVDFDLGASKLSAFVNNDNKLLLSYTALASSNASLTITDLSGKKLVSNKVTLSKGINQSAVDVSKIPSGLYVVSLMENNNVSTAKFVKK